MMERVALSCFVDGLKMINVVFLCDRIKHKFPEHRNLQFSCVELIRACLECGIIE